MLRFIIQSMLSVSLRMARSRGAIDDGVVITRHRPMQMESRGDLSQNPRQKRSVKAPESQLSPPSLQFPFRQHRQLRVAYATRSCPRGRERKMAKFGETELLEAVQKPIGTA